MITTLMILMFMSLLTMNVFHTRIGCLSLVIWRTLVTKNPNIIKYAVLMIMWNVSSMQPHALNARGTGVRTWIISFWEFNFNIFLDRVTIEHLAQVFKGKPDGINCKETWHDQTETLLPTTCPNCVSVLKRLLILEALWEIPSNFAVATACFHFYIHQSSWSGIPLTNHTTFMKMGLMHLWNRAENGYLLTE